MNNLLRLRLLRQFSKIKQKKSTNKRKSNFIVHKKPRKHEHQDIFYEGIDINKMGTMKELIFSDEVLMRQEEEFQVDSSFEIIDLMESEGLVSLPQRDVEISERVLKQLPERFEEQEEQRIPKSKRPDKERPVETEEDFFKEMNRLNKDFEKGQISFEEGDIRRSLDDYKKKQMETARSKLNFDDLLKIYVKFLKNPKVQKEKYIQIFETYGENPKEGFRKIKAQIPFLSHHNEVIFFLKAMATHSKNLDTWEIWKIWDFVEHTIVEATRYCSIEEMDLVSDLITQIGVVSPKFVHEYEDLLLESKSELFSIERAQIFNKFYKIIKFFVSQKEARSEFLFEISRWSILMHK